MSRGDSEGWSRETACGDTQLWTRVNSLDSPWFLEDLTRIVTEVGDKVDVRVTNIDSKTRKLGLSIKAREIAEEKEAVEQYGSSDSGASLGDILGAALNKDD